jgi:beta-phosphoglucomutase-like phosphatase (HAD superfamily)
MLPLLPKNKTVIFLDLDGVIFDSYGLWDEVIEKVLALANISYTQTIKRGIICTKEFLINWSNT